MISKIIQRTAKIMQETNSITILTVRSIWHISLYFHSASIDFKVRK